MNRAHESSGSSEQAAKRRLVGLLVAAAPLLTACLLSMVGGRGDGSSASATATPVVGAAPAAETPRGQAEAATSVSGPTQIAGAIIHTVQAGETLDSIAAQYGVTREQIQNANSLPDPNLIYPGQRLVIPVGGVTSNPLPTVVQPTAVLPGITPVGTAMPGPTPTAFNNPLADYTIDALMRRSYYGGTIVKEGVYAKTDAYTQYQIAYQSDSRGQPIRVTGLMNVPNQGAGPWPVIIVLHGGIDQSAYRPGMGTATHADFFARHGYVVFMPDYQTYNNTEGSGSPLKIPWAIDVMNLIAALPTAPEADSSRVGVLGHSRGGGIATYIMVISQVQAVSLYAPLHTDQAVNWRRYNAVFGASWPAIDAAIYGSPESNPEGYALVSPINYLDRVSMPIQIHHGDSDNVLPVEWSRDLYQRLLELGKNVEYYEYPGGLHSFGEADLNLFWQRNLAFFDTYVKQ